MKNIIIFGLQFESNLGDQVIGHCTSYLVKKALAELNIQDDVQVKDIDMLGRTSHQVATIIRTKSSIWKKVVKAFLPAPIIDFLNAKRNAKSDKNNVPRIRMRTAEIAKKAIDNDTVAIIFAGGGLIKYKAQEFYLLIDVITGIADRKSIPVMLNAVGVEGFDSKSEECRILKNALNRDCVKVITTRDYVELLERKYIEAKHIHTRRVPDPALWVDEIYKPTVEPLGIIGLSVARSHIFVEHGIRVTRNDLLKLWKGITDELDNKGIRWKYFSNGTFADFEFLQDLIKTQYSSYKFDEIAFERAEDPQTLVNQICSFSTILSVRLHAAIISYAYCVPVVQLVWNEKQVLFGKSIGYENRFIRSTDFTPKYITKIVAEAEQTRYKNYKEKNNRESTYIELRSFINKYVN